MANHSPAQVSASRAALIMLIDYANFPLLLKLASLSLSLHSPGLSLSLSSLSAYAMPASKQLVGTDTLWCGISAAVVLLYRAAGPGTAGPAKGAASEGEGGAAQTDGSSFSSPFSLV